MGSDVLRVAPAASARAASTGTASVPMKILISPEATWLITGRGVELCSTSNPRRRLPDMGGYCGGGGGGGGDNGSCGRRQEADSPPLHSISLNLPPSISLNLHARSSELL